MTVPLETIRVKPVPKNFTEFDEIAQKYNLQANWLMYSNVTPPKRGGSRESISDAKNIFVRASLDKIFAAPGSLREAWRVVVAMFDGCCYICGEPVYNSLGAAIPGVVIQADHIIPPSSGGTISAGNMAPAHRECNDLKGDTLVEEYLKDSPERLERIYDFQKMYNYVAPDIEVFKSALVEISQIWDHTVMQINDLSGRTQDRLDIITEEERENWLSEINDDEILE